MTTATSRLSHVRPLARPQRTSLRRERHEIDAAILVAVVALASIGILMVYSSSAMKAYLATDDSFRVVGPQIVWAAIGLVAMVVASRIDYRYLRLVSVPLFAVAVALLVLVLLPPIGPLQPIRVGGSARWLQLGPLPAIHPAEVAKLALVVYLAHWLARRGGAVRGFRRGLLPFLAIAGPVVLLVLREPDLGTAGVLGLTALVMLFVAGASLLWLAGLAAGALPLVGLLFLRDYQLDRIRAWLDPWAYPDSIGFHTIQGLLALGLGGIVGTGLGESRLAGGLFLPNASNDFVFAVIGEEFGFLGGLIVIVLFGVLAYQGIRVALGAPDTFGALLAAGITAWLTLQAFINIGVVVALFPITGITLPFISAGGSSLIVSFTAVGILLSISRETVERGTWNDASPDGGRRHGRAHLPGPRRGNGPASPTPRP
jgi:cell division protein FtsW